MPKCKSRPAALLLIAGLTAASLSGARADDACLAKPNAPAPKGQHWYYRHDRAKHVCWYLRAQGLPVRQHAPRADPQPAPQAAVPPAAPSAAPAPATTTEAPATDGPFATAAAPVQFLDVMRLAIGKSTAQPAAPPAADTSAQSASAGPLPARADATTGMGDPAPPEERPGTNDAADPAAHARVRQPPRHAAAPPRVPAPASVTDATTLDRMFVLLMLLFAGLAVGGPAWRYAQGRRAKREAAEFHPPPWARVVALNAPIPRIRVPVPRARKEEPDRRPAAMPRAPADHTERLAQALQQLANRLRAEPEIAPSLVPQPVRQAPRNAPHEAGQERLQPGIGVTLGIEKLREQKQKVVGLKR